MRGLAVSAVASAYEVTARAKRLVAVEREYFEDMMAEGRARFEAKRAKDEAKRAAKLAVNEARH
jgi:hypothetical protein